MKTTNGPITMMTPGVTSAPFSEAMPLHPKNADEVIAVNLGSSVYTLTGSITGGDVALDAGETAILVYAGSTAGWYVTWRSATGAVSYPISVDHGGTGIDGTGVLLFAATGTAAKFSSLDGISGLFQTGATDGSNAFPTVKIDPNTSQTSPLLQVGIGTSYFGTADPATDFFQQAIVSVLSDPNTIAPAILAANGPLVFDGTKADASGAVLAVGLAPGTGDLAAKFANSDQTGNHDLVSLGFSSWESNSIQAFGLFQFQNSGLGDGTAFFNFIFDDAQTIQFWSDGGVWIGTGSGFPPGVSPGTGSVHAEGNIDAATYSCSAMPAAAGASGTIYADPITHALFITP